MSVNIRTIIIFLSFVFAFSFVSCGGKSGGDEGGGGGSGAGGQIVIPPPMTTIEGCNNTYPCSVTISWDQNREKSVNSTGGGYRVYWKKVDYNFTENSADGVLDVGDAITKDIDFQKGTWYVKVSAYSGLDGGTEGELSDPIGIDVK